MSQAVHRRGSPVSTAIGEDGTTHLALAMCGAPLLAVPSTVMVTVPSEALCCPPDGEVGLERNVAGRAGAQANMSQPTPCGTGPTLHVPRFGLVAVDQEIVPCGVVAWDWVVKMSFTRAEQMTESPTAT